MRSSKKERGFRKSERRDQIVLELKLKPHVRVAELASKFDVTTETIRRDMEDLGRKGLLYRAHGGASAPHPGVYRDLDERRNERTGERERIGRLAASRVVECETLMIDAGATTIEFSRFLGLREIPVRAITNSLEVAMTLGRAPSAQVILVPGSYLSREAAVVGAEACEFLSRYNVDSCFIGASGLSEKGVTEAIDGFDSVKKVMMRQAKRRRFLIDGSKFGQTHFAHVADCTEIDTLITERTPPGDIRDRLAAAKVDVLTVADDA